MLPIPVRASGDAMLREERPLHHVTRNEAELGAAVQRGIAYLNKADGTRWPDKVKYPGDIDIGDSQRCVLHALDGMIYSGAIKGREITHDQGRELGFDCNTKERPALNDIWRREIARLKDSKSAH